MTDMTHDLRVSARSARLIASSDDNDDDDGPPWRFGGIAVAAGDILRKRDGTRVLFTAEGLEAAAETQAGEPLTKDHPEDDDGRPKYPPDVDETFGTVPKAGWVPEAEGVGYEAQTHDRNIAQGVRGGSYDVSVHAFFDEIPYDGPEADVVATNIRFGDLSVVSKGDSPNNTAEWGPNQALASWTESADFDELAAATHADTDTSHSVRDIIEQLARKAGLLGSEDRRGTVFMRDQTSTGEQVVVDEAVFDDAPWVSVLHLEGDEFADVGPGLGPAIGAGEVHDAGDLVTDETITLDDPLDEDAVVYNVLHFATEDGEVSDVITTSDGAHFLDSAFVGIAPDDVPVGDDADGDEATAQASDEPAESGVEADGNNTDMGDNPDAPDDGGDDDKQTLGEMTMSELAAGLREEGFATTDDVEELVAKQTEQADKQRMVEEIIAADDTYTEEHREGLMAAPDETIEREHAQVTGGSGGSQLPAMGGTSEITADMSFIDGTEDDEALDEYGTGVAE